MNNFKTILFIQQEIRTLKKQMAAHKGLGKKEVVERIEKEIERLSAKISELAKA